MFNRRLLTSVVAVAASIFAGTTAASADTVALVDNAAVVADAERGVAIQINSLASGDWGSIVYTPTSPLPINSISQFSIDYKVLQGNFSGGSPRFAFAIDKNNDGLFTQGANGDNYLVVYIQPNANVAYTPALNTWTNSGNLFANDASLRFEFAGSGGPTYKTFADIAPFVAGSNFNHAILAVDAGWKGAQSIRFDNISINGYATSVRDIAAVPTPAAASAGMALLGLLGLKRRRA